MKKILIKNDLPKIEKLYTFGRTSKLTSKIVLRIFDIHRYQNLGSDEIKKILDIEFPKAKLNRSTISRTVAKAKKVGLLKPLKKKGYIKSTDIPGAYEGRVQYKKILLITKKSRASYMGVKKISDEMKYKTQIADMDGNLKTVFGKTKEELQKIINEAPIISVDYKNSLIKFELPKNAINHDKTRYKIPTGVFIGKGKYRSQIYSLHSKSNLNTSIKYFANGAGGGDKILYDSIKEIVNE